MPLLFLLCALLLTPGHQAFAAFVHGPQGRQVERKYNPVSELIAKRTIHTNTQAVRTTLYTYDSLAHLSSITENGVRTELTYSSGGKLLEMGVDGEVFLIQTFNAFGDLASQSYHRGSTAGPLIYKLEYEYDAYGRLTQKTSPSGITSYTYSTEGQLTHVSHPNGEEEAYTFDDANRLVQKQVGSKRFEFTYNPADQITQVDEFASPTAPNPFRSVAWSWNADGTLASQKDLSTTTQTFYFWTPKKKLSGVAFTDGTSTAYAYLPHSDLRLASVSREATATFYNWDGVQLREILSPKEGAGANSPPNSENGSIQNLPTDSNPLSAHTSAWLNGLPGTWDQVISISMPASDTGTAEALKVFIQNHQKSVAGTIEVSSDPNPTLFDYYANGGQRSPEQNLPYGIGYTGRQHDTGTNLLYYRGRYLDSCTGSFIQEDPMRDGMNWYQYVGGDPVNRVDPSGYTDISYYSGRNFDNPTDPYGTRGLSENSSEAILARQKQLATNSIWVDISPILGHLKLGYQVYSGFDPISQEPVSRWGSAVGLVIPSALGYLGTRAVGVLGRRARSCSSVMDDVAPKSGTNRNPNKLSAHDKAVGEHTSFRTNEDGKVTNYETYDINPHTGEFSAKTRFRGEGKEHGGVEPPVILDRRPGKGPGSAPVVPRKPTAQELPKGY